MMAAFAAASVTFTSCSSDDDIVSSSESVTNSKIVVNPSVVNGNGTRATPVTSANYLSQMKNFGVYAVTDDGKGGYPYYLGGDNTPLVYTGDGKTYSTTDTYWWPQQTVSFFAYSPVASDVKLTKAGKDFSVAYTVPTDQSKQYDLLVAASLDKAKADNNGVVNLQFRHALSQVKFAAKGSKSGYEVTVGAITVHNVKSQYNGKVSGGTATVGTAVANYAVGLKSAVAIDKVLNGGTGKVSLTDADGVLMLAPQTLTKWNLTTNKTVKSADAAGQSYVEVSCKIYNKTRSLYLLGSDTEYGKVYIPLSGTWEAGKCYTYVLNFDGSDNFGHDDDGDPSVLPISFTVSVSDWQNASDSQINL